MRLGMVMPLQIYGSYRDVAWRSAIGISYSLAEIYCVLMYTPIRNLIPNPDGYVYVADRSFQFTPTSPLHTKT